MADRRNSPHLPPTPPARGAVLQPAPAGSATTPGHSPSRSGLRPDPSGSVQLPGPRAPRPVTDRSYRLATSTLRAFLPLLLALTPLSAANLAQPAAGQAPQIQLQPGATQPPPSELPQIVAQLAAQPTLSAADCEKLARETLTHGQAVRQTGQPVKPGIVHDGLAAVDRGDALAPKATDWPTLRAQLQELLQPPPQQEQRKDEQKQEEQKKDQQQQQQDQKQNDQQKSEEQKQQEQQQQQQEQQSEEQKRQEQQQQQSPPPPEPPKENQTQKIGGEQKKDDERKEHPELAVPLQKLDQVRDQDSPAELFELLHSNEPKPAGQPKKDW